MTICQYALATAFAGLVTLPAGAQTQPSDSTMSVATDCRGFNGIYVDAWWGGSAADTARRGNDSSGFRFDGRKSLDTTLTFNVSERQWSRSSVTAVVVAGVSNRSRSSTANGGGVVPDGGRNSANASGGTGRDWHVCTGATLTGKQPTLLLRGVRGQMRLKVDLSPLAGIRGGGLTDSTRTPRR